LTSFQTVWKAIELEDVEARIAELERFAEETKKKDE
jgi:hypothetical protein